MKEEENGRRVNKTSLTDGGGRMEEGRGRRHSSERGGMERKLQVSKGNS